MKETIYVLIGSVVFAVTTNEDNKDFPVGIMRLKQAPKKAKVFTLTDFLKMAKKHPILKQIKSWEPFWEH